MTKAKSHKGRMKRKQDGPSLNGDDPKIYDEHSGRLLRVCRQLVRLEYSNEKITLRFSGAAIAAYNH